MFGRRLNLHFNFSAISNRTLFGKLLRLCLKFVPDGTIVPILQGKLRGKKWIVGSSNHGCWLGSYEYEKQRLFCQFVSEGDIVFDIGAHVGFYTLLASVLVGERGRVFAFEPLPENVKMLQTHLRINKVNNVTVLELAVTDRDGVSFFELGESSSTGRLSERGHLKVQVSSIDSLVQEAVVPAPSLIKMDIEGAEFEALQGASGILRERRPVIFLATHGRNTHEACCHFLKSLGYLLRPIRKDETIEETDEIVAFFPEKSN
ncbi:MAG: FkbM family methyltransferase [Deltaproteobacteria bacterium]|nr:FkbM family methyltransferase [Deltaproteobacteria bacterium]